MDFREVMATDPRYRRIRNWTAAAVLASAFVFFAAGLGNLAPDLLEMQDLRIARDLYAQGHYNLPEDQSPVYYFLLHVWSRLTRLSSFALLRLPSAVMVALAVWLIFLVMEKQSGLLGGLLAAAFAALNPTVVDQARTARMYAVLILAAAACLWFAQQYLAGDRKWRYLFGFVGAAALGSYSHFFFLLFAGSMALLFLVDWIRRRRERRAWKQYLVTTAIGLAVISPQLWRVWSVMKYTQARQAAYHGVPPKGWVFLDAVGRELLVGLGQQTWWVLGIFGFLILAGMVALRWRGVIAGVALLGPTLLAGWWLAADNPVLPRYFVAIVPVATCLMAAGLARLRRVWLWAWPAAFVLAFNVQAYQARFYPVTDWPKAIEHLRQTRQPDDIVAVFPGLFMDSLYTFYPAPNFVGVDFIGEMINLLDNGRRIILVQAPGRPFQNIESYLERRAVIADRFQTTVRNRLTVYTLSAASNAPAWPPRAADSTIVLAGVVGSGGYRWQTEARPANPLAGVLPPADLAIAGFEVYQKPRRAWLRSLFGHREQVPREPNATVNQMLAQAGIQLVALLPRQKKTPSPEAALQAAGVRPLLPQPRWAEAEPVIFALPNLQLGVLHVTQSVFTDRPKDRRKSDARLADVETAVTKARQRLGPTGRLVVLLPQAPDCCRLFRKEDQLVARRAIDCGADAVVGLGAFAAREVETYRHGVIAYSLGALLRPPSESRALVDSSGIVLRLAFPAERPVEYTAHPVSFDETGDVALAQPARLADYVYRPPDDPQIERFTDRLLSAKAECTNRRGETVPMTRFDAPQTLSTQESYHDEGVEVAMAGVVSDGESRRALLLRPGDNNAVRVVFPQTLLDEAIELHFAVDDREIGNRDKPSQRLAVTVGEKQIFARMVPFRSGWQSAVLDTTKFAGRRADVALSLSTRKHRDFPVAVQAMIRRGPKSQAPEPYRFDEHLGEARVVVKANGGKLTTCHGPDETFRWLRNEERGLYGEGVLYRRWVCGEHPWDAAALTRQKSGDELRPAIWLHPLADAQRRVTYSPLPLRQTLRGYMGLTDLAVSMKTGPVVFSVYLDDELIWRETVPNRRGWISFEIPLPPDRQGRDTEISFAADAATDSWRHFCFNAWME